MKPSTIAVCLVVLSLNSATQAFDDKTDGKAMQGTWVPVTAELAGAPFPMDISKTMKLILKGDRYTVFVGQIMDTGTFTFDASKSPKTLDIKGTQGPNKDKTFLCIYKLKGDSLTVCYDLAGKEYPKEFKSKTETQLFLVEYKRAKP